MTLTASERCKAYRARCALRGTCSECGRITVPGIGRCESCRERRIVELQQKRWDARVELEYSWELQGFIKGYQAAEILGVTKASVMRRVRSGQLQLAFISGQAFWFKRKAVEAIR